MPDLIGNAGSGVILKAGVQKFLPLKMFLCASRDAVWEEYSIGVSAKGKVTSWIFMTQPRKTSR